ncbi:elongation factor P [Candidatus Tachikawaea gelatinosa]|uniref:Elongation factor P n=1 Tax=Candidatus Tachikawaea gelatinosa TaxID=1410383 RepID=A0A090AR65_9ENTR|nr:elongation factor P [Candidatus Tachikawaea gelatinosa]BAP58867.1 elongation factor P [Candidatus Tachikawaea gelatinosa]
MPSYLINNLRIGAKILFENKPYVIESNDFTKPGKGQAFNKVKIRQLINGKLIEKTFRSTELINTADIFDCTLIYLYQEGELYYFMNNNNFDQLSVEQKIIGDNYQWLKNQVEYIITLWNNVPISITPPNFLELKIIKTDPSIKGETSTATTKNAILSTGASIKVPSFIEIGETVKIDTRSKSYVSRVIK